MGRILWVSKFGGEFRAVVVGHVETDMRVRNIHTGAQHTVWPVNCPEMLRDTGRKEKIIEWGR